MTELEMKREFFKDDIFSTEVTGIKIEAVGKNYAKCSLVLDKKHLNAAGYPMGGAIYTLADFTFAVSTNPKPDCVTVTTVSQICYLNPSKGKVLYAESNLIKDGRSTCFFEIDITDDQGTKIAKVTTTGTHIQK